MERKQMLRIKISSFFGENFKSIQLSNGFFGFCYEGQKNR